AVRQAGRCRRPGSYRNAPGKLGRVVTWHSASGRSSLSSPIRVEAERTGPERNDLQQAAGYRDVLEEVDELVQVREVAVEASRGRKGEERQRPGSDSRVVADEQCEPSHEFDQNGERIPDLRKRQPGGRDVPDRAGGCLELPDDREEKDRAQQNAPHEGNDGIEGCGRVDAFGDAHSSGGHDGFLGKLIDWFFIRLKRAY